MLSRLKKLENDIQVAIIGMGAMGKGLFYQCHITPGIDCVAIADIEIERAIACAEWLQKAYCVVSDLGQMHDAIARGLVAVCQDGDLLARCDYVDALIEATNAITEAGKFSVTALEHHKHLVLMNAEIDLIFGPYLLSLAEENGVVYTSCDGDQHGVISALIDDLQLWGFELVMAGNIKGFLDRYSNPTRIIPEANKRNLDYKMATAYTDGTKLSIEMALVANAYGLTVSTPGMQGPRAMHVRDVFHLFDFAALREIGRPVVDYILGAEPGGGVFAVGYCDNPYQQSMMSYYKMGDGPFYLFYRPYHLCHVEAMAGIAMAVLDGRSLLRPLSGFQTNVIAYAKHDLHRGERLDGIGGYTCYGLIEKTADQNGTQPGLPICLAEDVILKHDVPKDGKIYMGDVIIEPQRCDFELYARALQCTNNVRLP